MIYGLSIIHITFLNMEHSSENKKQQIYVGKLPRGMRQESLEKEFDRFGKISDILLKTGYAFIVNFNKSSFIRLMKIRRMLIKQLKK
jgi:RNA recognition motif-containing protein